MADNPFSNQRVLIDRFGRRIDYLRVSITDRCNLRCIYCMPLEGVRFKSHNQILSYEQIAEIVKAGVRLGIHKVRITGGEPLVRRGITTLVQYLSTIEGIDDLSMTTNGILLKIFAKELKDGGLKRVNISLDSLNPQRYTHITQGGDIKDVFAGLEAAQKFGFSPIKINVVVIPGINEDEIGLFKRFAQRESVTLQFISRMHIKDTTNSKGIKLSFADRPPPCGICNRIRLTADGKLKPCLLSDREVDVYSYPSIEQAISKVVKIKPQSGLVCKEREMFQIGG